MFYTIKLFFEFLKIGALSFGGGMSTLPYIYELADKTGWIDSNFVGNIVSISQATPGPLACNVATVVGINVSGLPGAIVANIAFVIPAIVFVLVCSKVINKVKDNYVFKSIVETVKSVNVALLCVSFLPILKMCFLKEDMSINCINILFAIALYIIGKFKKIPSLYGIAIASVVGGIFQI